MNNEILAMASKPKENAVSDPLKEAWEIIEAQEAVIEEQKDYIAILEHIETELIYENMDLKREMW